MDLTGQEQEDKAMRKAEVKKSKVKRGNNMNSSLEKELNRFSEELVEVAEEMEEESEEGSTLEDIEGAKTLASEAFEKYSAFEKRLDQRDKAKLEQSAGPLIKRIKKALTLLKEAPE